MKQQRKQRCNSRCWRAKGKKCQCVCGGKQHGILRAENESEYDIWEKEIAEYWRFKTMEDRNERRKQGHSKILRTNI